MMVLMASSEYRDYKFSNPHQESVPPKNECDIGTSNNGQSTHYPAG